MHCDALQDSRRVALMLKIISISWWHLFCWSGGHLRFTKVIHSKAWDIHVGICCVNRDGYRGPPLLVKWDGSALWPSQSRNGMCQDASALLSLRFLSMFILKNQDVWYNHERVTSVQKQSCFKLAILTYGCLSPNPCDLNQASGQDWLVSLHKKLLIFENSK